MTVSNLDRNPNLSSYPPEASALLRKQAEGTRKWLHEREATREWLREREGTREWLCERGGTHEWLCERGHT